MHSHFRLGRQTNPRAETAESLSFAKARQGRFQRHEGDIQSLVFDSCLLYSVEFNCEFEPQLTVTQPTATGLFPRVIIIKVLSEFACRANASRD